MTTYPTFRDEIATLGPNAEVLAQGDFGSDHPATLADRYDELCNTPSDIWKHLPRFVQLVELVNAQHVIELGSRSGVSTVAWLYGLLATGGHLTSVDLDSAPDIGTWPEWCHVQGNDQDPEVIGALDPADIVFLDTSHHYADTVHELNLYRWLIKPGGIMCGHDSELAWPEGAPRADGAFPVKRAVKEFALDNGYQVMFYEDNNGLWVMKGW